MVPSQLRRLNRSTQALIREARAAGDRRPDEDILKEKFSASGLNKISIATALRVLERLSTKDPAARWLPRRVAL